MTLSGISHKKMSRMPLSDEQDIKAHNVVEIMPNLFCVIWAVA